MSSPINALRQPPAIKPIEAKKDKPMLDYIHIAREALITHVARNEEDFVASAFVDGLREVDRRSPTKEIEAAYKRALELTKTYDLRFK